MLKNQFYDYQSKIAEVDAFFEFSTRGFQTSSYIAYKSAPEPHLTPNSILYVNLIARTAAALQHLYSFLSQQLSSLNLYY